MVRRASGVVRLAADAARASVPRQSEHVTRLRAAIWRELDRAVRLGDERTHDDVRAMRGHAASALLALAKAPDSMVRLKMARVVYAGCLRLSTRSW